MDEEKNKTPLEDNGEEKIGKTEVKKALDKIKEEISSEFEGKAYEKLTEKFGGKFEGMKQEIQEEVKKIVKRFNLSEMQEEALTEEERKSVGKDYDKKALKEFVTGCTKGMFTGVGDMGGYFVTERQLPNFFDYIENHSFVRSRSLNIDSDSNMPDQVVQIPKLKQADDGSIIGAEFNPVGEGRAFSNTDVKLALAKLEPKKHGASVDVPNETIRNVPAAESFLDKVLRRAAAKYENYQFIRGTGGAYPVGVLECGAKTLVARTAPNDIQYTDIVNMLEGCMLNEKNDYIWLASQKAFSKIFPMVDGTATYRVYQNDKLENIPLIWTDACSTLGTMGDLMLCNFQYYLTLIGQAFILEQSKEHKFNRDMTVVRAKYTLDADCWLEKPILRDDESIVSPFVVLN
jgi:HK97 family phage major capsid protein